MTSTRSRTPMARGRRSVLGALILGVVATGGGYAAVAGVGVPAPSATGDSAVEAQAFNYTQVSASTTASEFEDVPGLADVELCAPQDGVSATVSLQLAGGPAKVRVTMRKGGEDVPLRPRAASFDPAGSTGTSFSFTFVRQVRPHLSSSFDVEWRAASATPVHLQRGSIRILYGVKDGVGCA
jgi:hypothetical protein